MLIHSTPFMFEGRQITLSCEARGNPVEDAALKDYLDACALKIGFAVWRFAGGEPADRRLNFRVASIN
jgi:hypothetical protein